MLAVDGNYLSSESEAALELGHTVFYFIFVLEMLIKLTGYGFKEYFKEKYNLLDFLVILVTSVSTAFYFTNNVQVI